MTTENTVNNPIALTIVRGLFGIALIITFTASVGVLMGKAIPEGQWDVVQGIVTGAIGMLAKTTIDRVSDLTSQLRDRLTGGTPGQPPSPMEITSTETVSVGTPDAEDDLPAWPEGGEQAP